MVQIQNVIAFTEVMPDGQRCTAAIVRYSEALDPNSLGMESFVVENRTVTNVYAGLKPTRGHKGGGNYAIIELDPEEAAADTLEPVPGTNRARLIDVHVIVRQVADLKACNGNVIPAWDESIRSDRVINDIADDFEMLTFHDVESGVDMPYRMYAPDLKEGEKAGLILYFHGGAEMGDDNYAHILRTQGAAMWGEKQQQERFKCFVLAPQYPFPEHNWIDPDTYEAGKFLPVVQRLVKTYVETCPIDTKRMYASGMSMGAMCCWLINYRYPNMFAAMLCTVGQGDYERVGVLKDKPIWAWNAENDDKSAEGIAEIMNSFELEGAKVVREFVDGSLPLEEMRAFATESLKKDAHIRHTQFAEGTLGEEWAHYGWKQVYPNQVVRDWLVSHTNENYSDAEAPTNIKHVLSPVMLPVALDCKQISAGNRHTLVLTEEGVYGWGSNVNGQLGVAKEELLVTDGKPVLVFRSDKVKKVSAGNNFSAILMQDGTVLTCGENAKGQLGVGHTDKAVGLQQVKGLTDVIDIVTGTNVLIALRADGSVWACGDNSTGQLCDNTYMKSAVAKPILSGDGVTEFSGAISIQAGMRTYFVGRNDGTFWAGGNGEYGQRGDGREGHGPAPRKPSLVIRNEQGEPLENVKQMGIARCFAFALTHDGEVYGWGWNRHGDLGMGDDVYRIIPAKVESLKNIVEISCGMNHTLALDKDGKVWSWGYNHVMGEGVLGHGDMKDRGLPEVISGLPRIVEVKAGYNYSLMLDENGKVWGCGCANADRLLGCEKV